MEAEDLLDKFAQDEGFGNWDTVVLNCHHSVIRSVAIAAVKQALHQLPVIGSLRFSEREVDFAYLCGVFNASGIDGLHKEIQRLKELGKEPHNIIEACR